MKKVQIDVWSDIACPWCWVGKKNLDDAIESFDGEVEVTWHAFQLNPSAPPSPQEPVDYCGRLAKKYGMSREQSQAAIDRMVSTGKEKGLEFRFDKIKPTNTFNAHRLLTWAKTKGLQHQLKERLFKANFNEGLVINDPTTLINAAVEVGLDAAEAELVVMSQEWHDEVMADKIAASQNGISGVPFFVVNKKLALQGAQPTEEILRALEFATNDTKSDIGSSCSVDGC